MYLCVRGIDSASFYDFSIGFWTWSDSVVSFCFSFYKVSERDWNSIWKPKRFVLVSAFILIYLSILLHNIANQNCISYFEKYWWYILINYLIWWLIWFLVLNATFSNISAISWRPVLVVEEAGVPGENHRPWASNWFFLNKLYHLRLRVECTLFVIYKAGCEPTPYWW